jgi:hypothetical protein
MLLINYFINFNIFLYLFIYLSILSKGTEMVGSGNSWGRDTITF